MVAVLVVVVVVVYLRGRLESPRPGLHGVWRSIYINSLPGLPHCTALAPIALIRLVSWLLALPYSTLLLAVSRRPGMVDKNPSIDLLLGGRASASVHTSSSVVAAWRLAGSDL